MKFTQQGLDLLKTFEGCRLEAYLDSGGIPSIGWGSTDNVTLGMVITQEAADRRLESFLGALQPKVETAVSPDFNNNEFSSACCFAYNVRNWQNTPLFQFLKAGDRAAAAYHWPLYCRDSRGEVLPGLERRRQAELALFLSPVA